MVDFNQEQTVSTPPADVLKLMILERRQEIVNELKQYHEYKDAGAEPDTYKAKATAKALYFEISAALKRWLKNEEYKELYNQIRSEEFQEVEQAIETMFYWLDSKRITRVDTFTQYDKTSVEEENKQKGT